MPKQANLSLNNARGERWKNLGFPQLPKDAMTFQVPNLTTTERDALQDIQNGILILNTTTNRAQMRINGTWTDL